MKKRLLSIFTIALVLIAVSVKNYAQDGIKIRVAVNSGMFLSEPGNTDIVADPLALAASSLDTTSTPDFKSSLKFGIEAEISIPIGNYFGVGFEIENSKYSGYNDNPIYYNYFGTSYSYFQNYALEPLIYNTEVVNLLGNIRIFPLGHSTFTPYLKFHGGVSMIGTDLRFKDPVYQVEKSDPLYSRGTRLSLDEPSKFSTANIGAGAGFEYQLTGNISLCGELTFSRINSDIIDGVPNFTYDEALGYSVYYDIPTITNQFSIGLCYTLGGTKDSSKKGGGKSVGGKTDSNFPFYKRR